MPNWVLNKVYFKGNKNNIKKLKNNIKGEESCLDFNKLIHMPEELNIVSGSEETIAIACAMARLSGCTTCDDFEKRWNKNKTFEEYADMGDVYLSNIEKYGASTWYDWSWDNWGTKWNACEAEWTSDNTLVFQTAWNAPNPIFSKMAKMFPDVYFDVEFADEDLGSNCGTITYFGEEVYEEMVNDFEFACGVWGYDPEELREEDEEFV